MPSRRQGRKAAARNRRAIASPIAGELELAERVERLAYTRAQAAEALGISLATFDRRVVPTIVTVVTEWGGRLIPVSELERYLAERTHQPRVSHKARRRAGRGPSVAPELVKRIKTEHAEGRSLGEIARRLNADGAPTAQGGRQWWPSTVRSVLARPTPPTPLRGG
jgi:hypothetical protein